MIFLINLTRGQMRFLTCVARVTCLVYINTGILYGFRDQPIIAQKLGPWAFDLSL